MLYFKAKSKANKKAFFGDDSIYRVFCAVGFVANFYVYKPVNIGAFGAFVKNRVDNVAVYFALAVGHCQIHQIGRFFGYVVVLL